MNAKTPTAQEQVTARLRTEIVTGLLPPGVQVRQEALAASYGVSRVPLREALKILEGEGLVQYYPHRGFFVTELNVADLHEIYRLRGLLEAEAIAQAVPTMHEDDVDAIESLLNAVDAAVLSGDLQQLHQANRAFHFAIFDHAGLPRLSRMLHQLWDATDVYRGLYFQEEDHRDLIAHEHRGILAALRSGDAAAVVEWQAGHRQHSEQAVSRWISGVRPES